MNLSFQNQNDPSRRGQSGLLLSTLFEWDQLHCVTGPHGEFRAMADAPSPPFQRVEMHATMLKPGLTSHAPHQHAQEEVLLIKEGFVESSINGKKVRVGAGSILFFASWDLHGLTNVGNVPALYYVLNFYTRAAEILGASDPSSPKKHNRYPSAVVDWTQTKSTPTPVGQTRTFAHSPTSTLGNFEAHAYTIEPDKAGGALGLTSSAQVLVVKEGLLEIMAGGSVHPINTGALVYIAANDPHRIRNRGAQPATYFLFSFSPLDSPEHFA